MGVILHGGVHMACDFPRVANANPYVFATTIGADFGNHQPTYAEIISTSEVMTGILMIFLMFIAYVLAAGSFRNNLVRLPWPFHRLTGFNAFWYSHHLFSIVYVLLIVHSMCLYLNHDWVQKSVWSQTSVKPMCSLFTFVISCDTRNNPYQAEGKIIWIDKLIN